MPLKYKKHQQIINMKKISIPIENKKSKEYEQDSQKT